MRGAWQPGGFVNGCAHHAVDLALQLPEVLNAPLTLQRCLAADGLGGSLAIDEPRPAVVDAVQTARRSLAGTVRLPASAAGR